MWERFSYYGMRATHSVHDEGAWPRAAWASDDEVRGPDLCDLRFLGLVFAVDRRLVG